MRIIIPILIVFILISVTVLLLQPEPLTENQFAIDETQKAGVTEPLQSIPESISNPVSEIPNKVETSATNEVRQVDFGSRADDYQVLQELSMDDINELSSNWKHSRGFAQIDSSGNSRLEQPYEQFDDETLRLYADNGDMWAQQILAGRIEATQPADALDLYQQAAQSGSIYAMQRMGMLYKNISVTRTDSTQLVEAYKQQARTPGNTTNTPQQLSAAWSIVAQMAGGNPTLNESIKARVERDFKDEELTSVCQLAQTLYSDLNHARVNNNQGNFDRSPPPIMMGSRDEISAAPCAEIQTTPAVDFSSCEEIDLVSDHFDQRMTICRNNGS